MTEQERLNKAAALHGAGFSCAQAVLGALEDLTGLDYATAMAAAGGFGAGCGTGELCGAISGAVMAIGLAVPHTVGADQTKKMEVRTLTQRLVRGFQAQYGCVTCRELVGKAKKRCCPDYIAFCTALAGTLIQEYKENKEIANGHL